MDALREMRIEHNTLIAFSSDHGPDDHGVNDSPASPAWCPHCMGSAGPLRGGKARGRAR